MTTTEKPAEAADGTIRRSKAARRGQTILAVVVGVLLAAVIVTPIALSSQDLVRWADSPTGLGLGKGWAVMVFIALDAAAATCVGMSVYCAWRGESAGTYGWLVWAFAGTSAFANYRFNADSPARDAVWFFPIMSVVGPFLLEVTIRRVRRWVQTTAGRYERPLPHFRVARWIPLIGAARETYGAWRVAILDGGISTPDAAVARFRQLCPSGRPAVVRAMREEFEAARNRPGPAQDADAARPGNAEGDRQPGPARDAAQPTEPVQEQPGPVVKPARRHARLGPGRRPGRKPAQPGADDDALLARLSAQYPDRPGKNAIGRALEVGGSKAARLAALIQAAPEWPISPAHDHPVQPINGTPQ